MIISITQSPESRILVDLYQAHDGFLDVVVADIGMVLIACMLPGEGVMIPIIKAAISFSA